MVETTRNGSLAYGAGWLRGVVAMGLLAALPGCPGRTCAAGGDGTFVQLTQSQLDRTEREWKRALQAVAVASAGTIIIQFSGSGGVAFDPQALGELMKAAEARGLPIWLGLHAQTGWPENPELLRGLPPPLGTEEEAGWARLCAEHSACVGVYIGQEIDESTFEGRDDQLRAYLHRSVVRLDRITGGKPIAIAPFFTKRLGAQQYAQWLHGLLRGSGIDEIWLQDGSGTGRANVAETRAWLAALRRELASFRVGAVVELFQQTAGPPWDERPFAARSASPNQGRARLRAARAEVERVLFFAIFDYADPLGDKRARALHQTLRATCEQ